MLVEWYCEIDEETYGPLPPKDLQRMAATGKLKPTDRVKKGESGKWIRAGSVKGLIFKETPRQVPRAMPSSAAAKIGSEDNPDSERPSPTRSAVAPKSKPRSFWLGFAVLVFGGLSAIMLILTVVGTYLVLRGPIETENKMVDNPRPGVIFEHKKSAVSFNPPVIIIPGVASVLFGGLFVWKFTKWKRRGPS